MAMEISLIPSEMIKLIPLFSGEGRHLNLFLRKCEYIINRFRGSESQNAYVMQVITSRLTGDAAALISERQDIETWFELKELFTQHFGDPRTEECISIELETVKIKQGESFLDFCNRIQTIRASLFSKVNLISDEEMRTSKVIIYDKMALDVFLYNLPENMVRIVRLKDPATLEKALSYVLEEVNFHNQYNARNKLINNSYSNIPKPQLFPPTKLGPIHTTPNNFNFGYKTFNSNSTPNFKFGIPGSRQVKLPQQFGYRPPPQQFGYRPPFQNNIGYRPPQPMGYRPSNFNPNFIPMRPQQFGQQAFRPAGHYNNPMAPLQSTDVSMRTAPPLKQSFKLNEIDIYEDQDLSDYYSDSYYDHSTSEQYVYNTSHSHDPSIHATYTCEECITSPGPSEIDKLVQVEPIPRNDKTESQRPAEDFCIEASIGTKKS